MLPASVSFRRALLRVSCRAFPVAANGVANASIAPACVGLVQMSGMPFAVVNGGRRFSSLSPITDFEDDVPEVVLEPLSGFVDQKPLTDFNLSDKTLHTLQTVGITHLFPVQAQSFDVMMRGSDIVGRSKTGSGKTLAFALPIVEKIYAEASAKSSRNPRAMILLPTRELAQQVCDEVKRIAPQLRVINVVGGVSYTVQENHLRRGVDILVGTPGRITDLVEKGSLSLEEVRVSVLDEADMMLKFGFQEAVETILGWVPQEGRQCVMWSATFPKWVNAMAKKFTKDAVNIDLVGKEDNHVPATVSHKAIHAPIRSRVQVLENVLRHHARGGQTLIFTETKQEADEISIALSGMDAKALHGDLSQGMRSSTMEGFRNGSVKILVCTDIAARGLDIANVELVVQYRLPHDKESFVHRAGRTGRAGRSGTNIVFFDHKDSGDVRDFERRYKFTFTHASAPHVEQILGSAVEGAAKKLNDVPRESVVVFQEAAERLYAERGVEVLSSALALLCGFDRQHLSAFSMLTGRNKTQTIEVAGVENARKMQEMLVGFDDSLTRREIHTLDDKFIFDIPQNGIDSLRTHLAAGGAGADVTVSPVYELSRILAQSNGQRSERGFGGNRNNGGDRRRDGGFGGFSGRRNNNNRDRDFDSGFSRPRGGDRDRSPRRGSSSSFGRFSDSPRRDRNAGGDRSSSSNRSSGGFRESW